MVSFYQRTKNLFYAKFVPDSHKKKCVKGGYVIYQRATVCPKVSFQSLIQRTPNEMNGLSTTWFSTAFFFVYSFSSVWNLYAFQMG